MNDINFVLKYIHNKKETEYVDFKESYNDSKKAKHGLVKDIISFANNTSELDKYIIFGVENESFEVVGINKNSLPDISDIEQLLDNYVEPFLKVELNTLDYENKTIAYLKIFSSNINRPYQFKKDGEGFQNGNIFIRKGATNCKQTRLDIVEMISSNNTFEVYIHESFIYIGPIRIDEMTNIFDLGEIKVQIKNNFSKSILIDYAYIEIENGYEKIRRTIYNRKKTLIIHESPIEVPANSNRVYDLLFAVSSSDMFPLHILEDGECLLKTSAKILLYDTESKEYSSPQVNVNLFAKGDVLWKVKNYIKDQISYLKKNLNKICDSIINENNILFRNLIKGYNLTYLTSSYYNNTMFNRFEYKAIYKIIKLVYEVNSDLFIPILLEKGLDEGLMNFIKISLKEI